MLRLWRFVKIVEELSVGESERMEEIELKLEQLEEENERLKEEVSRSKVGESESGEQHLPEPSP
jgi:cell shape-determining protein MreC